MICYKFSNIDPMLGDLDEIGIDYEINIDIHTYVKRTTPIVMS